MKTIKWFINVIEKHLWNNLTIYVGDPVEQTIMLESGENVSVRDISPEGVRFIISNGDVQGSYSLYFKEGEKFPNPISPKDALALLSGSTVSSPAVPRIFEKKAKQAYARKIIAKARSLFEQAKSGKRKYADVSKLMEKYTGVPTLAKLKNLDRVIGDFLATEFGNVSVVKPRGKNLYFRISVQ